MVLVFLKNLISPQPQSPRYSPAIKAQLLKSDDIEAGLPLTSVYNGDFKLDHGLHSPSSSVSGDTVVEAPSLQPLHRFTIDPRIIADATIGLSDGLTVPFALTAGLSALGSARVVIFGGLAEICAGAISMGIGGYLAAKGEADAYNTTVASTRRLVQKSPSTAAALAIDTLAPYLPPRLSASDDPLVDSLQIHLAKQPELLISFLLRFRHSIQGPSGCRSPYISALTIALGYFLGGFTPLVPYFFAESIGTAFGWSVVLMVIALFAFGAVKTGLLVEEEDISLPEILEDDYAKEESMQFPVAPGRRPSMSGKKESMTWKCTKGGVQMVILGGVAAAAAVGLVRLFSGE